MTEAAEKTTTTPDPIKYQDQAGITTWTEITYDEYWEALEVLPPALQTRDGFLIGEPTRHNDKGEGLYGAYLELGERGSKRYYASDEPLSARVFASMHSSELFPVGGE